MKRLLVIVPTRGRPGNAVRLLDAVAETTTDVDVIFCVDTDDLTLPDYVAALPPTCLVLGDPARLGPWLNKVATRAGITYWAVGFMGDDHMPQTPGWDQAVLASLDEAGRYGMCYGDDGHQGERLATAVFMRSSLVAHLGWMVPCWEGGGLEHLYIDNAWMDIGQASGGLRYLSDVKITHLHPDAGLSQTDATYRSANSKLQYSRDKAAYREFKRRVLPGLVFPVE